MNNFSVLMAVFDCSTVGPTSRVYSWVTLLISSVSSRNYEVDLPCNLSQEVIITTDDSGCTISVHGFKLSAHYSE